MILRIADEVREALAAGRGVVALESSLVAQGLPEPHNLETALAAEDAVHLAGAVPATTAVDAGELLVGLPRATLERLADTSRPVAKAGSRDLGPLLAAGQAASTTVSAAMRLAHMAGIRLMATGGIGGVHRGAELSFDISADLEELGRTPVAVVCAGAKAILDIPKTLEVLETKGVPVIGYGTDDFPAFWTRSSGHRVDQRLDTAAEVAALLQTQFGLGMGGVLIGNPIPEAAAMDRAYISEMIERALADADGAGIAGKATTPYLLKRIFELTEGRSLVSNIALVENNARVAAEIAVALAARSK